MRWAVLLAAVVLAARATGEELPASGNAPGTTRPAEPVAVATSSASAALRTSGATSPATPASEPTRAVDMTSYAGTYRYTGGEAERAAVKVAVDRATDGMFGILIARGELMKRSEIRPTYTLRFERSGVVSVETPGFPPEASPLDGTEVVFRTKYGDVVRSSQRFVGGALLQRGRTDDGSGLTEFRLQPDGNTLVVTRVSQSPKLPRTVEFTLTYRRDAAGP